MHIDSHEALGVLNTLFEILAPSSLRPVDMLLRSMFVTPDTMVSACLRAAGAGPRRAGWLGPALDTVPRGRAQPPEPAVQRGVGAAAEAGAFRSSDQQSGQRGSVLPGDRRVSSPQASVSTVQLWVSGILAILRVLISQSTEDIVLSRIQELAFSPHLLSCPVIDRLRDGDGASAPAGHSAGRQVQTLPEETFSR